jgi:hypothetical protein
MNLRDLACFEHVQWEPDRRELQSFARSMVIGFFLIGLLAAWRAHSFGQTTFILWGVGLLLGAAALTPGLGRTAYLAVYLPTSVIGHVVSRVLLFIMFVIVFVPLGLLLRLMGKDLLRLQTPGQRSMWVPRTRVADRKSYYRQF